MVGFELAITCLALNIYHEARNDPLVGQLAVAMVTLNRTRKTGDVCQTVFEPYQFSWTIDGVKGGVLTPEYRPKNPQAWRTAQEIAKMSYQIPDFTHGATHFHTRAVNPKWNRRMQRVGVFGSHVFYRDLPQRP